MKRILLLLLVFIGTIYPKSEVIASHGLGGEITWTCLPSGQFKFKMKFYRDCNGIPAPVSVNLTTTVPGVPSIPMTRTSFSDITPLGTDFQGDPKGSLLNNCATCANPGGAVGVVQEHIYESAPVTLNGVPPLTGWQFYWGECCRSNALSNITNPGSTGFRNRAIMYPYNGQNTNPCFDSSPFFAEKPSTIICTGYPFKYNPNAIDPELDSLRSEWGQPLNDAGGNVAFSAGYNLNSQLPSTTQNPANVPATINPITGEMSYTLFTGGYYVTVVKVTAYKCGQKVAEVFREINVVLNNSCPTIGGGQQNLPPNFPPPFPDPVTGVANQSYIDTVYAGDTVNFAMSALDFQTYQNGANQNIVIQASGSQFGTNFSNQNSGCIIPPCATLTPAFPTPQFPLLVDTFLIGGSTTFRWITTCSHVEGLDTNCRRITNTYNFVIKASDDYCPANASNVATISIVILGAPPLDPPVLRCASVNLDGGATLSWTRPTPRDTQNTFYSYDVYASLAAGGPWTLVDSVITPYDNPATYTYTQTPASLNAMFGTNAQNQSIYYHLVTRSGCRGDSTSVPSNVLRTIKLNAALNGSNEAVLTWNPLCTPALSSHAQRYMIHREYPIGTWALIDSTTLLTYTDTLPRFLCTGTFRYRVSLADSSGCISWSSLEEVILNNPNPAAVIVPANPQLCQGATVTLTCTTPGTSYSWSNGAAGNSITVGTSGTYTVTVTQASGCNSIGSTVVTVNPNPVPNITGTTVICQGVTSTFNAGAGYTNYQWSGGLGSAQNATTGVAGTYTVTVTDANGCTGTDNITLTVNPIPAPVITGITTICQGQNTVLNAGPGFAGYNWGGGNVGQTLNVTASGTYTVTVTTAAGCTASSSSTVTVNPLPAPAITGTLAICQGATTTLNAGPGFNSYQWSGGLGAGQNATTGNAGTYTVTVTNANGCSNSTSATVVVNPNPVPVIAGTNVLCQGATTTFNAGAGYSAYQWSGGLGATQTVSTGTAGTYTVTVTTAAGCTGSANVVLTVNPNPAPSITGNTVFCQGQNSNLNAGGGYTSYNWGGGNTAQLLNVTNSGNYTVTVTNAFGCTGTATTAVTVNPLPAPSITGTLAFCQGSNTTLNATPGFVNYQWSGGLGANPSVTVSTANTFTVTVTDANGCVNSTNATTVVNANPIPNITGTTVVCQGVNTTFNAGAGYSSYQWANGLGSTQNITTGTAGAYTVTVTDANGCTGTDNISLTVNPNPAPSITGNTTFCQGQNSNLNAGGGYASYNWGGGNVAQVLNVTSGGTYTVTVTNAFGCSGTASTSVTVNPLPSPSISGSLDFCQGFNTTLDAGAGYTNYQWSGGQGTNQTITVNNANTYTVTVTDVNGCVNSTSATTVINPNPVPVITGTFSTCDGSTTAINAGAGYSNYVWSTGASTQSINVGTAGPFTVTVTDINGCVGTTQQAITVYQLPSASIAGTTTICAGQSTNLSFNFSGPGPYTYTYFDGTSNQGPFTTAAATASIPVTPGGNTTYTLVSISNANCSGSISGSAIVSVTPLPTAVLTGTTAICDGDNTNLSIAFTGVGPFTYSYTAGSQTFGPFISSSNPEIINVAPGATTTYGLTANVSGGGCTSSTSAATATVTVNALPSVVLSGDNTVCNGTSTDLTLNFVGTGPYTYTYFNGTSNIGPVTTSNNPETISVTPGVTTTYTLVSLSDANCPGSVAGSAEITVNQLPSATMSGTASICDGTSTDLTVNFTGTGPYTYSYNDGSTVYGPFTTNQNPILINVGPTVNTNYGITTISDANCPGSGSGVAAITVIPLPTSTITGSTEICVGSSTNLSLTFTGVPPFEYSYTDGSIVTGPINTNNFTASIPVSPNANTSYNVTFISGAGCAGSSTGVVDIIVNAIPAAEAILTGNSVICSGENSEFQIQFTGIAPYTYSYTDGTNTYGPFTTSNNPEIIAVTPGSTTSYSLVNMADSKCTGTTTGTAQVIVNPLPVATVSGTPTICEGSGTSFTIGFTGTGPFTYAYTDGTNNFGPFTTSNNPETIPVAPLVSTSYTVIGVNDANCTGSSAGVASVTVNQIPTASLSGNAMICEGDATNLNIDFTGVAPFTYTYTDGSTVFGPISSSNNPVVIPVSPGSTTNYSLVAINDANCPGTLSGSAEVFVNPLPQPAIVGDLEICDGESSSLAATPGYATYVWSSGGSTNVINATVGGIYAVTVTDLNGCVGSTAVNFIVNQTPVISFTNDTSLTCSIPKINFINNSTYPAGSQFVWDFGDTTGSALSNPSHIYNEPGTYNVTLTINTVDGCTATSSQSVDIMFFPLADADFTADPEVTNIFNGKVQFTDLSDNAVSWLWDFNDGSKSIEQNPYHYFNEIGEYKVTLTVTNIAGCPDLHMREIVINPFYIPNAFTPNADGINDYFFDAGYVLDVKSFSMQIFNRWGQRVYETNDYTKFWNGFDTEGNPAQDGVYVYTIDVTTKGGKEHQFKGTVTLVR